MRCVTQDYKEFLEELIAPKDKKAPFITDYKEYHTDTSVHLSSPCLRRTWPRLKKNYREEVQVGVENFVLQHAFNEHSIITKYESAEDIMKSFVPLRLKAYEERRQMLIKVAESELVPNKAFILAVVEGSLVVNKRRRLSWLKSSR